MIFCLVACGSAPPVKDYQVILWEPSRDACFKRLLPDDTIEIVCKEDSDSLVGITLEDYHKELDYQSRLIKSCKKWKPQKRLTSKSE